jgi:hypothetical protein
MEGDAAVKQLPARKSVALGRSTLVAHLTAGHKHGCTTWTDNVQDGAKIYNVVFGRSLRSPAPSLLLLSSQSLTARAKWCPPFPATPNSAIIPANPACRRRTR